MCSSGGSLRRLRRRGWRCLTSHEVPTLSHSSDPVQGPPPEGCTGKDTRRSGDRVALEPVPLNINLLDAVITA